MVIYIQTLDLSGNIHAAFATSLWSPTSKEYSEIIVIDGITQNAAAWMTSFTMPWLIAPA